MISVTRHIEYLITCNDCVIVPGWGAFIAHSNGASLADDGVTLLPPSRTLSFNPGIDHNDGLLVTSIMRREGVTYEAAMQAVEDEVVTLRHQLEAEGEIVFPRIGRFTLSEGEPAVPVFTPAEDSLASGLYFALPKVKATPLPAIADATELSAVARATDNASVEAETAQAEPHTAAPAINTPRINAPVRVRRALRVAASVTLCLALGIVISTPIIVHNDSRFASVDPSAALPKVTGPKAVTIHDDTDVTGFVVKPSSGELFIAIPAEATTEATATVTTPAEPAAAIAAEPTPVSASHRYYLIVASLKSRRQADKFIASHNDESLKVLEQDGRYRVYAATGATFAEAREVSATQDFAKRYPDSWVYKKK